MFLQQIASLIASDTITVPSEEKVYESVIAWVRQNPHERGKHLSKLMEHVRLPLLSRFAVTSASWSFLPDDFAYLRLLFAPDISKMSLSLHRNCELFS